MPLGDGRVAKLLLFVAKKACQRKPAVGNYVKTETDIGGWSSVIRAGRVVKFNGVSYLAGETMFRFNAF